MGIKIQWFSSHTYLGWHLATFMIGIWPSSVTINFRGGLPLRTQEFSSSSTALGSFAAVTFSSWLLEKLEGQSSPVFQHQVGLQDQELQAWYFSVTKWSQEMVFLRKFKFEDKCKTFTKLAAGSSYFSPIMRGRVFFVVGTSTFAASIECWIASLSSVLGSSSSCYLGWFST